MKRKASFLPAFFFVVIISFIILTFSLSGKLKFLSFLEKPTSGIQSFSYNLFQKLPFISEDLKIKELKEENLNLLSKIANAEKLKRQNAALSDQFKTSYPPSVSLLKAEIIAAPGFIPGISLPTNLIINKGSKDNIKAGQVIVVKNNLIGIIAKVSNNLAQVNIINNSSSFTAKTENGALGLIKGIEGNVTLDNVLLSENIKAQEIVLTYGDINSDGVGIPADLVIGKITEIEKNPSDLFQKAKIESFVDFTKLSIVFIYFGN